jgi:hypothetical protein
MQSIDDKLISMVYGHGRGFVFTPKLFSSLGDQRVVRENVRNVTIGNRM